MKSSTPKLPADPVSFDVTRRQNTRTAKELKRTPTTMTLLVLSLGTTPHIVLVNFSVAVQLEWFETLWKHRTYSRLLGWYSFD
jgi:hypothetical protein